LPQCVELLNPGEVGGNQFSFFEDRMVKQFMRQEQVQTNCRVRAAAGEGAATVQQTDIASDGKAIHPGD